jgi:archaellum component FlaC
MTDNQEKQLFTTLETLVSGMRVIQTDVKGIKVTLNKHSQILESHSQILERLDAKTDAIAEKVINHEIRLTKAENDIEELRGGVH